MIDNDDKIIWHPYYFIIQNKKYVCKKLNEFLIDDIVEIFIMYYKDNIIYYNENDQLTFINFIKNVINKCLKNNISLVIQDCENYNLIGFLLAINNNDYKYNVFSYFSKKINAMYEENNDNISTIFSFLLSVNKKNANIIAQCTHPLFKQTGFGNILRNQFIKICKENDYSTINFHTSNKYMVKIWSTYSQFKIKNEIDNDDRDKIVLIEGSLENLI